MMMNANPTINQPLVTLNTSALEIPSQSWESFGEHGSDSGQHLVSTGNDYEVVKQKNNFSRGENSTQVRKEEMEIDRLEIEVGRPKTKIWADQVEDEEDDVVSDSEDEEEGDISDISPTVPKNNTAASIPKTELSPLTLVFVPSSKAMISVHDRALLDALYSPKPKKVAYSTGSKSNAQLLQFSGDAANVPIQHANQNAVITSTKEPKISDHDRQLIDALETPKLNNWAPPTTHGQKIQGNQLNKNVQLQEPIGIGATTHEHMQQCDQRLLQSSAASKMAENGQKKPGKNKNA